MQLLPALTVDGMSHDDGHNALLPRFRSPSESVFEADFDKECIWMFPPRELVGPTLHFIMARRRMKHRAHVALLVPDLAKAPWFHQLRHFRRVARYCPGSDLFRERDQSGNWRKLPATKEADVVVASF